MLGIKKGETVEFFLANTDSGVKNTYIPQEILLSFNKGISYNHLMTKIRKLYYFDKKNTQEMISFLNNNVYDTYINHIMFNPFIPLHHLLPLKFKFLPESYLLKDKKRQKD